mgnify:CR=1 FL=1
MHIGLIGGIGPAATNHYHKALIAGYAGRDQNLDLTIVHADSPVLLANQAKDARAEQSALFVRVTERLAKAGADFVAVTSIAGHFCIEEFKRASPLPVIDMVQEVTAVVTERGLKKLGVLGTRTVMETKFYGQIHTAELLAPPGELLDAVHQNYIEMAAAGRVTDAQIAIFDKASRLLIDDHGAESIMLAGTDLALVYDEHSAPFPVLDCAAVHVAAILKQALGKSGSAK